MLRTGKRRILMVTGSCQTPGVALALAIALFFAASHGAEPKPAESPFSAEAAKNHQQEWAKHLKQLVVVTNSIGMKLTIIPPGKFVMGSPKDEIGRAPDRARSVNTETEHEVEITKPFYLGIYEVTQKEYDRVVGKNPSWFSTDGVGPKEAVAGQDTRRFPVEWILADEAIEFCRKLSELPAEKAAGRVYRLPTEAEWEYAYRAGTTTAFYTGKSLSPKQAHFDALRPYYGAEKGSYLERTIKVGSFDPNPFGLYDMAGNVWEWCQDRYGAYDASKRKDPLTTNELRNVIRGGSWYFDSRFCRAAERGWPHAAKLNFLLGNDVGFRVACSVPLTRLKSD
jgi:formylglycine-generating enzyme required for sulfatase activity